MNLVDELYSITSALTAAGIRYAVCGGVAVTLHGATRSTKDIDLLVSPDDVQRVLDVVRPLGYAFAALPMTFDAGTERERHVQRVSKIEGSEHLLLDLLVADAAFEGALDDRVEVQLPSGPMSVVSRAVLIRMNGSPAVPRISPTSRSRRSTMSDALDPRIVVERLAELRRSFVAETVDEARERLAREQPRSRLSFAERAHRSLEELRALCELTRTLHAVPRPPSSLIPGGTSRVASGDGEKR